MKKLGPVRAALLLVLPLAGRAVAGVIHVPENVSTIQQAIVAATPGDFVVVGPGTYHEALDFLGKDIRLISLEGAATTVIDATGLHSSVVRFLTGEPPTALLSGFTLTGGVGHKFFPDQEARTGGGIMIAGNACPRIVECIITDNHVSGEGPAGGGVFAYASSKGKIRLQDCVISNNSATGLKSGGGGVSGIGLELIDCQIVHNWTDGPAAGSARTLRPSMVVSLPPTQRSARRAWCWGRRVCSPGLSSATTSPSTAGEPDWSSSQARRRHCSTE